MSSTLAANYMLNGDTCHRAYAIEKIIRKEKDS